MKKEVKQVKLINVDVGFEVIVEISSGFYCFVYCKCFYKWCEMELIVLVLCCEQLIGDEVYEWVWMMLVEMVDIELWYVQWVLQVVLMVVVDLFGCDVFLCVFDFVVGDDVVLLGIELLFIEWIEVEYVCYFILIGCFIGEWFVVVFRLVVVEVVVVDCVVVVVEVDDGVCCYIEFIEQVVELLQ